MSTTYPNETVAAADERWRLARYTLDTALRFANEDYYVQLWRRQAVDADHRSREAADEGDDVAAGDWQLEAVTLRELAGDRVDERTRDERAALEAAEAALMEVARA